MVASWSVGRAAKRSRVIWPLSSAYHWTGISIPTWRVAACACGATSSKSNPQLSSQPARSRGRQRRTAAKIADTLFNHAPLRHAKITDRRRLATVWIIRPRKRGRVDRPVRTNRPFCVGDAGIFQRNLQRQDQDRPAARQRRARASGKLPAPSGPARRSPSQNHRRRPAEYPAAERPAPF